MINKIKEDLLNMCEDNDEMYKEIKNYFNRLNCWISNFECEGLEE